MTGEPKNVSIEMSRITAGITTTVAASILVAAGLGVMATRDLALSTQQLAQTNAEWLRSMQTRFDKRGARINALEARLAVVEDRQDRKRLSDAGVRVPLQSGVQNVAKAPDMPSRWYTPTIYPAGGRDSGCSGDFDVPMQYKA